MAVHATRQESEAMPPRYFFAIVYVCSQGVVKATGRKLSVEVEVDSAEIDTRNREFRMAVKNASAPYTARHFNNRTEMLRGFELVPTRKVFKKFESPVETSLPGVRIWGVMDTGTAAAS
jgi:hypothetical protein